MNLMGGMDEETIAILIDGNAVKAPVAFCHYYKHRGYLTPKLIRTHGCIQRHCGRLEKLDCPFWEDRKNRKAMAKQRRKEREERKL